MKRNEILSTIKQLAGSQGFYSRLYQSLVEAKEAGDESYDNFMNLAEKENFKDAVDLVLWIEG